MDERAESTSESQGAEKELGNAGYEVRRKCGRRSGEASRSDVKGTLLRVSGSNAAGYFRVWKVPKPKRKPGRPRAKEEGRAKEVDERRGRTRKEDIRPRTQEKRPSSKLREEKKQDPEKPVKRTIQKSTSVKTDRTSNGQEKTHDPRAARTKTSTKSEGLRNAARNL
ncbi:hypothetical protein CB1_000322009 [Camelus ferus]|nr:hypothetical protein CB1_000322009 [Camelus ferus]